MSGAGRTVYIAGAGIAGLALALALAKFGARVVVLERNAGLQEYGAGLQISPNARRVLNQLGLDKQIAARSFEPEGIDVYPFRSARPLTTLALGPAVRERFGAPYVVMHRADLAQVLFRACRRFANIDMVFGTNSFAVENAARGVIVSAEAASGMDRNGRAFAFVGADGVNSHTRTGILHGHAARFSGYVSWRATLEIDALAPIVAMNRTSLFFGPGYHAVCYPLPQHKKLNLVLFLKDRPERIFGATPPTEPMLPKSLFRSARFEAILGAAKGKWGFWPLSCVTQSDWHQGSIGLVGDAAHAMLPFQAQGAAMGIEDAAILAPLLITEPSAESAFVRYEAMRRERVARVARVSGANGRAFHLGWPFSLARNAVIGLQGPTGHFARLDWLYGYDPAPEISIAAPKRPS
jgi:salicylate hydroxylase